MSLEELEALIGKDQLERLFLEHYLNLIGKDNVNIEIADDLTLGDIME